MRQMAVNDDFLFLFSFFFDDTFKNPRKLVFVNNPALVFSVVPFAQSVFFDNRINIKPLKDQDLVELKRAINKLKKTADAVEGDIAGFGEDWLCICPSFAKIHREPKMPKMPRHQQQMEAMEEY